MALCVSERQKRDKELKISVTIQNFVTWMAWPGFVMDVLYNKSKAVVAAFVYKVIASAACRRARDDAPCVPVNCVPLCFTTRVKLSSCSKCMNLTLILFLCCCSTKNHVFCRKEQKASRKNLTKLFLVIFTRKQFEFSCFSYHTLLWFWPDLINAMMHVMHG